MKKAEHKFNAQIMAKRQIFVMGLMVWDRERQSGQ